MSSVVAEQKESCAKPRACPSAFCDEGASLLGVMTGSGRLAYLPMPVVVDSAFAARLQEEGRPESRYRFTQSCVEGACPQWTGQGCGVIDHLLDDPRETDGSNEEPTAADASLPACGIRRTCRWFFQHGASACAICPSVVADIGGSATHQSVTDAR